MATIITEAELASYLQVTTVSATIVARVNAKVTNATAPTSDDWAIADDVPGDVKDIALEVAARASRNPRGVTSQTTSVDDWTRTERWEGGEDAQRTGVYFTDAEKAELALWAGHAAPSRGSVKLHVPGYSQ